MEIIEEIKSIIRKNNILLPIIHAIFLLNFILSIIFLNITIDDFYENPLEKETYFDKYYYFKDEKNISKINESNILNIDNLNECDKVKSLIMLQNQSLASIFELKTNTIHTLSVCLKAFDVIMFFCVFFMFMSFPQEKKGNEGEKDCCSSFCADLCFAIISTFCFMFFLILFVLSLIIQIIIFSVLCGKYNKGGMNNFLNFLECNNINKETFEEYSILNDFSYHIILLKAFQSIYIIYSFLYIVLCFILFFDKDNISYSSHEKTDNINNITYIDNNNDYKKIILNN